MAEHADALVDALAELRVALTRTRRLLAHIDERAEQLALALRDERLVRDVLGQEPEPRLVQLLSDSFELMQRHGAQVRHTEAQLLYGEGLTMDEIADLFGVSRQRVGALIRGAGAAHPRPSELRGAS